MNSNIDNINWFTSYYANIKNLNGLKVSISRFIPYGIGKQVDFQDIDLSPTPDILQSKNFERFKEQLQYIDFESKINEYEKIAKEKGYNKIFLLCYETPDKFCHRQIVSEFIKNFRKIEEYNKEDKNFIEVLDDF
jgi:uncharacterized protein YeaO (DUF488 family)